MKTFRLTLVAMTTLCALAGAATQVLAQDQSQRTRADVIAEVHAARAAGTLGALHGEDSGSFHLSRQPFHARPRAEVVAELDAYRDSGEMAAQAADELAAIFYAGRTAPSTLTRAEVQAEVLSARARGELGSMLGEDSGSFQLAQRGGERAATRMARPRAAPDLQLASDTCPSPQPLRHAVHYAMLTR